MGVLLINKSEHKESVFQRHSELLLEIEKFINLKGKKVLDFGCGSGVGTVCLSSQNIDVVGVDNNQPGNDSIKEAEEYALECRSKATFACMDGESLNFPEESFDAVLAVDVFEHLKAPRKVLSEIKRVLKVGGSLVMIWQPYYAPYGGHLKLYSKNPWRQLMPFFNKEKYLQKACKKNPVSSYKREIKVLNSLNKLTMRRFRKMIISSGLNLRVVKRVPFRIDKTVTGLSIERLFRVILNKLPLIPIIEEFTTQSVLIILEKKD